GREAQVGDLVETAQRLQDRQPDLVRVNLGLTQRADRLLHLLGEHLQLVLGDRPALAGLARAADDLVAAERLGRAGALDDRQRGGLDRAEAPAALRALTAPPDDGALLLDAAVDHAGVGVTAERAVHLNASLSLRAVGLPGDDLWMT